MRFRKLKYEFLIQHHYEKENQVILFINISEEDFRYSNESTIVLKYIHGSVI